jgi:LmbE family N-acetylglucosaminyl deacetylase
MTLHHDARHSIDVTHGTDEAAWTAWSAMSAWPRIDPATMGERRVVVLAAHPDDEVLAVGGTLALLARLGAVVTFVWATSGEASHPGSQSPVAADLARLRVQESRAALATLGVGGADAMWLGLPDGGLDLRYDDLVRCVRATVRAGDVVLAPFRGDGHPDHEACGHAAALVAGEVGAELAEFPIWAWNWAEPEDPRVPWRRAGVIELPAGIRAMKAAAIQDFHTQVQAIGPAAADGPVLPEAVLAHFRREIEVLFR